MRPFDTARPAGGGAVVTISAVAIAVAAVALVPAAARRQRRLAATFSEPNACVGRPERCARVRSAWV